MQWTGHSVSILEVVALVWILFLSATNTNSLSSIHGPVREVSERQVNCEHQVLIMQDRKQPLRLQSCALRLCVSAPHPTAVSYTTRHRRGGNQSGFQRWWKSVFGYWGRGVRGHVKRSSASHLFIMWNTFIDLTIFWAQKSAAFWRNCTEIFDNVCVILRYIVVKCKNYKSAVKDCLKNTLIIKTCNCVGVKVLGLLVVFGHFFETKLVNYCNFFWQ